LSETQFQDRKEWTLPPHQRGGQAVVQIALADATGADLFRTIVALILLPALISFVLNVTASVKEADRPRQDLP
jgi:hypothetical protein